MSTFINDIDIQISLQNQAPAVRGFGLPLILGNRAARHDLVGHFALYSSAAAMLEDEFTTSDPEYKMAGLMFGQSPRPRQIAVYIRAATTSIGDALGAAQSANSDWYAVLITERTKTALHAAGDWALANRKLFFGCTADLTALTARNNIWEAYYLHKAPETYPEAALVGLCLPQRIGSLSWAYQTPTGVAAAFTLSELNTIRTGKGQTFSERGGLVYSNEGLTTGGQYIDIMQTRSLLEARLGEATFGLLIREPKISMDGDGLFKLEAAWRGVLDALGRDGNIAVVSDEADRKQSDDGTYMYQLRVPQRSEIAVNERAARNVAGVTGQVTLAGAVHKVTVGIALVA